MEKESDKIVLSHDEFLRLYKEHENDNTLKEWLNKQGLTEEEGLEKYFLLKRKKRRKFISKWSLKIFIPLLIFICCGAILGNTIQIMINHNSQNNPPISTPVTSKYDYADVKILTINDSEIFNRTEEFYLVYLYGNNCSVCNEIKDTVIDFALNSGYRLYFTNDVSKLKKVDSVDESRNGSLGKSKAEDLCYLGTPTMYVINKKQVVEVLIGGGEITQSIEENNAK